MKEIISHRTWQDFYKKLRALGQRNLMDIRWDPLLRNSEGDEVYIRTGAPIHLIGVAYSIQGRKSKTLDVLINGEMRFGWNGDEPLLNKYATCLAYFDRQESMTTPLLNRIDGMHCDYERYSDYLHPIFHAQHKPDVLDDDRSIEAEIVRKEYPSLKTVRIPTAQLDLASALLMVFADYLVNKDNYEEFKDLIKWSAARVVPSVSPVEGITWPKFWDWYISGNRDTRGFEGN